MGAVPGHENKLSLKPSPGTSAGWFLLVKMLVSVATTIWSSWVKQVPMGWVNVHVRVPTMTEKQAHTHFLWPDPQANNGFLGTSSRHTNTPTPKQKVAKITPRDAHLHMQLWIDSHCVCVFICVHAGRWQQMRPHRCAASSIRHCQDQPGGRKHTQRRFKQKASKDVAKLLKKCKE